MLIMHTLPAFLSVKMLKIASRPSKRKNIWKILIYSTLRDSNNGFRDWREQAIFQFFFSNSLIINYSSVLNQSFFWKFLVNQLQLIFNADLKQNQHVDTLKQWDISEIRRQLCHFSLHGKILTQSNGRNFKKLLVKFLSPQNSCNWQKQPDKTQLTGSRASILPLSIKRVKSGGISHTAAEEQVMDKTILLIFFF